MIDELIKRRVVQLWLSGESRDKIASDLQIGAGTVSGIVSDFKKNLQGSDIDSVRELTLEAKKQEFTLSDLAPHIRLHNFFIKSGASEEKVESFITSVSSTDIPSEKTIELLNQLFNISRSESIPLDQVPGYIKEKIEEKQKIEEEIKQADATLQSKNVSIQTINEHIQLDEELKKYRLSTKDIHRLLDLLLAAKEYRYSPGKIVAKLRNIKRLENKENKLKNNCEMLSKKEAKYKEVIPLANLIWDLHISRSELISFKAAVNETAGTYGLTPSSVALDVINLIIDHNKKGQLKRELSELSLEKYAIDRFCSSHSEVIMSLMNLRSHGLTDDRIIELNNFLEKNRYNNNINMKSNS
jgi:hypothetical protein